MNMEILKYKQITGKDFPVFVQVGAYRDGSLAVTLLCADSEDYGLPFTDVTKHVGSNTPLYCAAVKNYMENEGMVEFLIQNGLGKPTGLKIYSGYAAMPVFQFDKARLQMLDPKGYERYEKIQKKPK